ncbi:MAG: type II secretion system protein [Proteobacteria bacterium]|nr:type II secretion system protein [Pseudomonadota bacterium]
MKVVKQAGFTLIELGIVITIIGTLAAVAAPRFIAMQRDARVAKLYSARGAVSVASTLVHMALIAKNSVPDPFPCAGGGFADNRPGGITLSQLAAKSGTSNPQQNSTAPGSVCSEHGLIATIYGYAMTTDIPAQGNPGIVAAAGLSSIFNVSKEVLQKEGYEVSVSGPDTVFQGQGAPDMANCQFVYTQALSPIIPAQISVVTTTGC